MNINVDLRVSKKTRKLVRDAIKASARVAPLHNIYEVNVKPVKKKHRKNMSGEASLTKGIATIKVDFSRDIVDVLDTVFHETYHLHQMGVGKLKQGYFGFWWKGFFIPVWLYAKLWDFIPFEREAVAHAEKMVKSIRVKHGRRNK